MAKRRRRTTAKKSTTKKSSRRTSTLPPKKKKRKSTSSSGSAKCGALLANLMVPHPEVTSIRFPDQHYGDSISHTVESIGTFITLTTADKANTEAPAPVGSGGWVVGAAGITVIPGRLANSIYFHRQVATDNKLVIASQSHSNDLDKLNADCDSYRCTGATLEVEYIGDSNNNGGEMLSCKFDLPEDTTTTDITMFPEEIDSDVKTRKFSQARHGSFVTSFKSNYEAYGNLADPASNELTSSLEAITIRVSGAHAAGANFRWKLRQNIEIRPKKDKFLHKLAKLPPPHLPVVHTAYDMAARALHIAQLDIAPAGAETAVRAHVAAICNKSMSAASSALNGGTHTASAML